MSTVFLIPAGLIVAAFAARLAFEALTGRLDSYAYTEQAQCERLEYLVHEDDEVAALDALYGTPSAECAQALTALAEMDAIRDALTRGWYSS